MKNFYILFIALTSTCSFAQFTHVKPNKEVPGKAVVVLTDGTTKEGTVKNNKADDVLLRVISQDNKAFSHANVALETLKFKPEGAEDFQEIDINVIDKVVLIDDETTEYDRIKVYRFDKKDFELKNEGSFMLQNANFKDYLEAYSNIYINLGQGGAMRDTYYYYIKLKDAKNAYFFDFSPVYRFKKKVALFKIFAPKNNAYVSYLDKLADDKSAEYKEFDTARINELKDLEAYIKNASIKDLNVLQRRSMMVRATHDFLTYYIGKKLEHFNKI